MRQITSEEAIKIRDSGIWQDWSHKERAAFQLHQNKPAMPFDIFHEAVTKALGRDVYTHEFAMDRQGLIAELNGKRQAPTMEDIINLIPPEQRMVIEL